MKEFESHIRHILQQERQTSQEREREYQELIMAVGNKHEGETRHQTALRYLKQAEICSNGGFPEGINQAPDLIVRIPTIIKTREICFNQS